MYGIRKHRHRYQSAAAVALVAVGFTALPASARPDPGQPLGSPVATSESLCALSRVGAQFVRCDNLTGNGVAAPGWVPER